MTRLPHAKRAVLALVFAFAMLLAFANSTYAAEQNPECLSCHSGLGQDWTVGAVDRDTACVKCHTYGLAGTHPYHNGGGNCGAVCHKSKGWGESLQFAVPSVLTARGSFASPGSDNTDPSVLHVIHSSARWPASVSTSVSECGSCHAPAACDACHSNAPDAGHAVHSSTGDAGYVATPAQYNPQAPWTGTMSHGIIGEDQSLNTAMAVSSQCAASGCHDIDGSAARKPLTKEDFNHIAYPAYGYPEANNVATTGSWSKRSGSAYTGGSATYSNYAGATFTFNITGNHFALLTDVDPFRGQAEVLIDGTPAGTIDCYSPSTKQQQIVFRSGMLTPGAHTVTVRVLGTKQAASQGTWVFVDALRAYSDARSSVAPKCADCHPDRTAAHGTGFPHETSSTAFTAGTYQLTGSGTAVSCASCHTKKMIDEHKRASSKTEPDSCAACHTTYAPYTLDSFDYSCTSALPSKPGCHKVANGQAPHNFTDGNHTASDAGTAECRSCHGSDLAVIHDDSNPARPQHASLVGNGYTDASGAGCLFCHSATTFPSTKDCTNAGCHTGSGVVSMATHPAPAHTAAPATNEASRTGGLACAVCHRTDLTDEHFKGSSLTSTSATIGCASCHGASYLPAGWITPPNNTCISCHPANATKAGAPHEAADYANKHDFSAYSAANTASCGGANCHNVSMADVIHNPVNPGNGACTSCHDTPNSVPTEQLCSDCHSSHPAGVHTSSQTECLDCHTGKSDISTGHASCATCHADPRLTDYLKNNYTAQCTSCHNATVIGTHAYTPADDQHYTPALTSHTASPWTAAAQGAGGDGTTPAGGKECSACHTSTLKAAHANTSSSGGSVTCVECHTNATLGGATQVAANWTNNKCKDCHDAGSATTHDGYASVHVVSTNGCAGSGSGCHGTETDLAKLHDMSQSGGAPTYSSCSNNDAGDPSGCHAASDARPAKAFSSANSCGNGSGGCHADKTTTNHGPDHDYTSASNANVTAMTGCTNSGAGCHGTTTVPGDAVTDFHTQGAIDCMTSKCHTSSTMTPAWKTGGSGAECSRCHAGNFVNAPDTIALTDAAPGGHYGETTHTAGGLTGTVTSSGSASATCANCHNPVSAGIDGLYAQHQGFPVSQVTGATYQNVTCGECHNYSVAITAVVNGNWATKTCAACHDGTAGKAQLQHGTTAPTVNATSPQSCGATGIGCHTTYNVHALHKDAAGGCNLTGCHDYTKQGLKPTAKSCGSGGGACHTTYNTGTHYNATTHTSTNMTSTLGAYTYDNRCADCHTSPLGSAHTTTSVGAVSCTTGGTGNTGCHNQTTPVNGNAQVLANWSNDRCSDCHAGNHNGYTTGAHTATLGTAGTADGCANTSCHSTGATADVRVIHDRVTSGCTVSGTDSNGWSGACHDLNKPMGSTAMSCGQGSGGCHANHTNSNHMPQHDATSPASDACVDCHETYTVTTIHAGKGDGCNVCHGGGGYSDVHAIAKANATGFECLGCHDGTIVGTHTYTGRDNTSQHYSTNTTTHTASAAETATVNNTGGYGCTQCHNKEMWPAHSGPTPIAFNLSGYADKCVACHELKVDNFTGAWGKTCLSCHTTSATHNSTGTKHDASAQVMASPGSTFGGGGGSLGPGFSDDFASGNFGAWTAVDQSGAGGTTTIFSDGFESGNTSAWDSVDSDWNASNATDNGGAHSGSWFVQGVNTSNSGTITDYYITKNVDLSALSGDATLTWWENWGGCETSDFIYVEYFSGGSWTAAYTLTGATLDLEWPGWSTQSVTIPQSATAIRWHYRMNFNTDIYRFDDVTLTGPLPASPGGWDVLSQQARGRGTGPQWYYMTKTGIDNSNAVSVNVDYDVSWTGLEPADDLVVQYTTNNGGSWTDIKNYNFSGTPNQSLTTESFTGLPAGINGIRFGFYADSQAGDTLYIDDVIVAPQSATGGAGSAAASCMNNPNGTECHVVTDVAALHNNTTGKCTICHKNNTTLPIKNCQASGCHTGVNIDEHVQTGVGTPAHHENGGNFTAFATSNECSGCHDDSVANEHFALTAYSSKPCSVCHATNYTVGTYSPAKATVTGRITARDITCNGCHTTSTQASPHAQRMGWNGRADTGSSATGGTQFNNVWSGHRSFSSMPGQKTSFNNATDGVSANRTWSLPSTANYLSNWSPLTESSTMMVTCVDCHGSVTGATGPHGGSMTVNIDPAYTNNYSTGGTYINGTAIAGNGICAKCHQVTNLFNGTANGNVHNRNNHKGTTGGRCINCHVKIPHAWKRPRLIGYTSDPAPYASLIVTSITDRAYTPTGWSDNYCGVGGSCGSHPNNANTPLWP